VYIDTAEVNYIVLSVDEIPLKIMKIGYDNHIIIRMLAWSIALCGFLYAGCGGHDGDLKEKKKGAVGGVQKTVKTDLRAKKRESQESVSKRACSTCHTWPAPDVLNRDAWVSVLDMMEPWVGVSPMPENVPEEVRSLYPTERLVNESEWREIKDYYLTHSPANLPEVNMVFDGDLELFEVEDLEAPFSPFCMAVRVESETGVIWAGWGVFQGDHGVYKKTSGGGWSEKMDWGGLPSQIRFSKRGILATLIGSYFPSDTPRGALVRVSSGKKKLMVGNLRRPTDLLLLDIDGSGQKKVVFCEYGNLSGGISLVNPEGRQHSLHEQAGILNIARADFNGDGHLDIVGLAGQAREGVILLMGDGKGQFEARFVLPRHPAWGHSNIAVADLNRDSRPDLIVTNGDNADTKDAQQRPYHGVRIHLNDGNGNFKSELFFHHPGAYRALVRDFDSDGDLDIAAIAYENGKHPALLFLLQHQPMQYLKLRVPGLDGSRWITMDAGDVDQDGDLDLVLGAMETGPSPRTILMKSRRKPGHDGPAIILLRNRLRQK